MIIQRVNKHAKYLGQVI